MGRPGLLLAERRGFWRLIAEGWSTEAAGSAVGASKQSARRWFNEAGGVSPIELDEPSGRYLGPAEREVIALRLAAGCSQAAIARELGRHPATIGREVRRNRAVGTNLDRGLKYRPRLAQHKAERRARRPKPTKLELNPVLREVVQVMLDGGCSPEQISGRLKRDFPDDLEMRMSHEAIYRSIYVQGRGELRRELTACLRTGRAMRKPRRRVDGRRATRIPDMVMIAERPPVIDAEDKPVLGDWEGDLIIGEASGSAIGTLVERRTGFVMLLHLPDDHRAETVRDAIVEAVQTLPDALKRSLTWDQGIELAKHAEITAATDLPVYFCDPHSPWQRAINENTNGLLRQYFPKGVDLSPFPKEHLDAVAAQLNARPRKRHGFRTPAEVLADLLSEHEQQAGIATTG
jgi:IS30 family transposase